MNSVRLTPDNSRKYVGNDITFILNTNGTNRIVTRQILRVSKTGKTIYIDYPDLNNKLLIISTNIDVILDEEEQLIKRLEEVRRRKEEQRLQVINKLREQQRNKILAKIRYLEYELELLDTLKDDDMILKKI